MAEPCDYRIGMTKAAFDDLIADFTKKLYLKTYCYKKIPYNTWRTLISTKEFSDVSIKYYSNMIKVEGINEENRKYCIVFDDDDMSFGTYLKRYREDKYNNSEKETDNMKNFNFEFGPCTDNLVRVSMYGLAIKNTAGTWVSYNTKDNAIVDVDVFSFDNMGKFIYKIPVAVKDVAVGDIVIHNRVPMFVEERTDEEHFIVVDVRSGERKEIIPTRNMLGFNFITKVVSLFNAVGEAPTPEAPFGNMLPFLMMDEDNKDINPMMLMLMAQSQGGSFGNVMNNPMMLYCMMKNEDNDILPWFFMMNNFNK